MRLNKIPLAQFINILEEIYNSGANFVDIVGFPDSDSEELKDIIKLVIRPDYLADDDDEEEGEDITGYIMNEDEEHDKLSEEDISDLI